MGRASPGEAGPAVPYDRELAHLLTAGLPDRRPANRTFDRALGRSMPLPSAEMVMLPGDRGAIPRRGSAPALPSAHVGSRPPRSSAWPPRG